MKSCTVLSCGAKLGAKKKYRHLIEDTFCMYSMSERNAHSIAKQDDAQREDDGQDMPLTCRVEDDSKNEKSKGKKPSSP